MQRVRLANVVMDCADPARLPAFWSSVTGYLPEPGEPPWADPSWRDADWVALTEPSGVGPRIAFQRVPEGKMVKNRVHMDLAVQDEEAEATRIQGLGASFLWRSTDPEDPFVTLADPEGNEFCVARSGREAP